MVLFPPGDPIDALFQNIQWAAHEDTQQKAGHEQNEDQRGRKRQTGIAQPYQFSLRQRRTQMNMDPADGLAAVNDIVRTGLS